MPLRLDRGRRPQLQVRHRTPKAAGSSTTELQASPWRARFSSSGITERTAPGEFTSFRTSTLDKNPNSFTSSVHTSFRILELPNPYRIQVVKQPPSCKFLNHRRRTPRSCYKLWDVHIANQIHRLRSATCLSGFSAAPQLHLEYHKVAYSRISTRARPACRLRHRDLKIPRAAPRMPAQAR